MFALIQSKNHAANKGKTAGRYQFDTHPTGIGLRQINMCPKPDFKYEADFKEYSA